MCCAHSRRVPAPTSKLAWNRLRLLALGLDGKLQAAHPRHVDPVPAAALHDLHLHVVARRASHDDAGRMEVDDNLSDHMHLAAVCACALGHGHLHGEDLAQEAADRVAVELHVGLLRRHAQPPVAPKRSVLTDAGSNPMSTSRVAAFSTIGVGPQTYTMGICAFGHATSASMALSIRRA